MKIIAAVSASWGIGCGNELLYRIPEDMEFFRKTTTGNIVIMGRNTFQSISRTLPDRTNIVMTSKSEFRTHDDIVCAENIEHIIRLFKDNDEAFVIGGAQLYETSLEHCTEAFITKIHDDKPADRFFPNLDEMPNWKVTSQSEMKTYKGLKYQFLTYENTDI